MLWSLGYPKSVTGFFCAPFLVNKSLSMLFANRNAFLLLTFSSVDTAAYWKSEIDVFFEKLRSKSPQMLKSQNVSGILLAKIDPKLTKT
jgi:hypothetical protein